MAVFPCDHTPHRYPGAQRSIYITRFAGSSVQTRKLRLCPRHFGDMADVVAARLKPVEENSNISMVCAVCDAPYDEGISVRLFDGVGEPGVWAAEFCAGHADITGQHLLWSTARPL
jgi:hypothetical protein